MSGLQNGAGRGGSRTPMPLRRAGPRCRPDRPRAHSDSASKWPRRQWYCWPRSLRTSDGPAPRPRRQRPPWAAPALAPPAPCGRRSLAGLAGREAARGEVRLGARPPSVRVAAAPAEAPRHWLGRSLGGLRVRSLGLRYRGPLARPRRRGGWGSALGSQGPSFAPRGPQGPGPGPGTNTGGEGGAPYPPSIGSDAVLWAPPALGGSWRFRSLSFDSSTGGRGPTSGSSREGATARGRARVSVWRGVADGPERGWALAAWRTPAYGTHC